jgi:hypothetical protein
MNDRPGTGARRSRLGRARVAIALPAIAAATLLAAACQGSSAAAGVTAEARYQGAQAFARCMRSHGVPDFPDPDINGHLLNVHIHESQGTVESAQTACQHLLPGSEGTAAQQQQKVDMILAFAQCMRAHGLPDFPDPRGGSIDLSHVDVHSPQFLSADRACQQAAAHAAPQSKS